jgi:hypothetical protein
MRHLLVSLAVLFAISGCDLQDNGFGPTTGRTTSRRTTTRQTLSVSSVRDSIVYTFSVARGSLGVHDTLAATFALNNESSATDTLILGGGRLYFTGSWWLTNANGRTLMFQPRVPAPAPVRVLLGSHQSLSELVVDQSIVDTSGAPVLPGVYTLHEQFDGLDFALNIVLSW